MTMITGGNIYHAVKAEMLSLRQMDDSTLRALLGHLGRKGKTAGTAGRIWGEALAEAALRFIAAKPAAEPGDGTGALTDFVTQTTDPDSPEA